jgi:hypothetical protein
MTRTLDASNPIPPDVTFTELGPCPICASYVRHRGSRIRAEIRRTTPPAQRLHTWRRFMAGVHQRHLAHATQTLNRLAHTTKETR